MLQHISRAQKIHLLEKGNSIKLDFPLSDIDSAAQGAMDLMIFFKDGGAVAIRDFYRHKPIVIHGDREFAHDEFLAMLEELAAEEEEESQRQHDYDVMDAMDGIDHLDGLDMTTSREFEESDEIQADAIDAQDGKIQTVVSLDPSHPDGPAISEKPTNPDPVKPGNPDPVIPSDPDPVTPDVPEPAAPVVGEAFSDEKEWNAYRKGEISDSNDSHITIDRESEISGSLVAENRLPDNGGQGHTITAPEKWQAAQEAQEIIESQGHTITAPQKWAEAQEKLQETSVKPEVSETISPVAETKPTTPVVESKTPVSETTSPVAETKPTAPVAESKAPVTETASRNETPVAPTETGNANTSTTTPVAETKAPETSVTTSATETRAPETSESLVSENKAPTTEPIAESKTPDTGHTVSPVQPEISSGNSGNSVIPPVAETKEPVTETKTPDPVVAEKTSDPITPPPATPEPSLGDDLVAQAPEPAPLTIMGTGNARSAVMTMRAPRMMSAAPSRAPAAEPDAAPSAQADDAPVGDDETTEPERYESEIFFDDGVTIVRVLKQGVHGHVEQTEDGRWMYILDEAIDSGDVDGRNIVNEGDQVMLLTRDAKGVTWPVRVIVHIKDDVPDLDIKGEETVETGHEQIGTLTYDFGADDWGGKMSLKVEGPNDAESSTSDFESPLVIAGTYGTLTVNKDGSYSYQANPLGVGEEGGTDTFSFTITDADGDTTSLNLDGTPAQLTFTTEKPEEPEPPTIPDVSEKNLTDGTDPDNSALTVNINIPEGFSIVSVKTDGEDHAGRIVQQDGKWVYILDKSIDSGDEQGQNRVEEGDRHIVIVQDEYGNQWEIEVPVAIVDDAPDAVDDSSEIDEGSTEPVTGNVLDNDKFGADGRADDDSFHWNTDDLTSDGDGGYALSYGTITLNADGSYSYTLDNTLDAVKALKEGETLTEEVTYTIKDKDGDVSTATLTITIKGQDNEITITPEDPDPENPDNTIDLDTNTGIVTVYDGGLENGNDPGKPTTTSGQFKIDAPDGLASIKITDAEGNETSLFTDGVFTAATLTTAEGKLEITGYDPDTGTLTYTFTLEKPGTHPEDNVLNREFTVSVEDTDGSTATSAIKVVIKDDEPQATDDTNSIDEGATEPVTGNVVTNDTPGADGFDRVELVADPEGTTRYGELTLNADGSYSYALNNDDPVVKALKDGETLTETYTYKLYDKDGDYTEATLTITINGKDNPITITPEDPDPENPDNTVDLDTNNSIVTVYDSGLENGTEEGEKPVSTSGQFKIDAPDGLATISVNGTEIWKNGVLADEADRTFETDEGKLVITGYDPDTGTLTYTFTLEKPGAHPEDDDLSRTFTVSVTDTDGSEAEGTIKVVIRDDEPIAEDDTNEIDEGTTEPITGDVTENDKAGADSFDRVELVEDPEGTVRYGELTLNADGTYSYTLDNDNPTVMALKDGETLEEVYTYRIYDKDGDYKEATLTITINGKSGEDPEIIPDEPDPDVPSTDPENPDAHGALIKVYEKHLPDGTAPDGDSLTVTGTMQVTAPDGLKNVKIGETEISTDENTPTELTIGGNTLKVWLEVTDSKTGVVHYTFTLDEEMTHPDAETLDDLLSEYLLTVEDYEGKTGSCNLHVIIVDDGPEISVGDGQEVEIGDEITIPDFEAAFGADNGDGKSFVITIGDKTYIFDSIEDVKDAKGAYGQIDYVEGKGLVYTAWAEQPEIDWDSIDWDTIDWDELASYYDEDGNFDAISFLKDQGIDLKDEFTFTITDADGDKAEATWSVDLVKEAYHGDTDADEALRNVKVSTTEKAMGDEIEIVMPEGYEIREITEQPEHGTVSQKADGKWVYVLNEAIDSSLTAMRGGSGTEGENLVMNADSFKAIVTTPSGKAVPVSVPVHIVDDVPVIEDANDSVEAGSVVTGNLGIDWGADGGEGKKLIVSVDGQETEVTDSATVEGKFGALTINADGSYSYEAGLGGEEIFVLDGVTADVRLPAGNSYDSDAVRINIDPGNYINPENPEKTISVSLTAALAPKTVSGMLDTVSDNGIVSEYQLGQNGYTVKIVNAGGASQPVISFDGSRWTVSDFMQEYMVEEKDGALRATGMSDFSMVMIAFADALGKPVDVSEIASAFSALEVDTLNRQYSGSRLVAQISASTADYNASYNEEAQTVVVSLKNGGTVVVKLTNELKEGDQVSLDIKLSGELKTASGSDEFTVKAIDADGDETAATLTFDVKEPPKAPEIAAITADEGKMSQSVEIAVPEGYEILEVVEQGQYGTVSQSGDSWAYALNEAIDSGDIQGANKVEGADSVKLKVTDGAGHEWTIDVPVDIVDAVPTAAREGSYELEPGRQANGTLGSIDYGKDGKGKFVVDIDGEEHEVDPTAVTDIAGTYGTLKIAMGGYVYTAKSNAATGTDNFTIRVIDGDGDIAESSLTFKVKGNEGPLPPDPDPEPDDPVDYPEPQISATAPITLYESGLRESGAPEGESASQTGHFLVNLFGDDGSIEIEASRYNSVLIEIVNGKSTFDPVKAGVIKSNDIEFKVTGVELQADGQWKVSYACELPESGYFDRYGEPKAAELDISATNSEGESAFTNLTITAIEDNPTFSDVQHGQTQYEWIYSVDGENRTGLADKNGQMENNALYKSGTFAFEIGADGMEYGADTPFHLARMKDDGTFTSYSGFGVEVEGNITTFYTSSRGKEAALTITDNGDGTFAYEFSDPFGICWDYDENFYLVASDADGSWTDPKQCGYIEIPVFGNHDYTYLGNVNPVDFNNGDTEELGYVNVTFAEGVGGLSATRETPMDGKVLIGEEGNQIMIQIADGKVASIMATIDGSETEIPFTVSKYGALQFTGDPADGTITVNGIEMYVENIASNFDPGSWQITLNSTLIDGQDAVEWRYVPVTAINENGHEVHTELNFRLNNAPTSDTPANSANLAMFSDDAAIDDADGPSFLDLFTEQQEMLDEMEKTEPGEKPKQAEETTSTLSLADLLAEESDYDEIILPGSDLEPENGQSETAGQTSNNVFTSAADFAGDDIAMLAAQHEVENV